MSEVNDKGIVVRIEVLVPLTGAVPEVRQLTPRRQLTAPTLVIQEPPPPNPNPPVRLVRDQGASGGTFMCAYGTVSAGCYHIVGRVYPAGQTPPTVPNPCDTQLRCAHLDSTRTSWEFSDRYSNELPGATCNPGGTSPNTLVVWALDDSGYHGQSRDFLGLQSTATQCQVAASGSGGGSGGAFVRAHAEGQLPATLTAEIQNRAGALATLPPRVILVKEPGRQQWSWRCSRVPGRELVLVQDDYDGLPVYRLKGAAYDPPLVAPQPGASLSPLELVFDVRGRATPPGSDGSFTVLITE